MKKDDMAPVSSADQALTPRGGSGAMFDTIARRYDMLNRLMSFGIDRRWRKKTVAAMALDLHEDAGGEAGVRRALDLATGTADLAIAIAETHPAVQVVGVDPSTGMLEVGRRKLEGRGLSERVRLEVGDAQSLDFDTDSFDAVSIAFGIRNVPDRLQGLREMARVTRPGGRVAILELSEPRGGVLAPLARFHIHTLVPRMGALLSGAKEYRYLQQSIAAFPPAETFADMMREAGLDVLAVETLTFGVCHLYVGTPRAGAAAAADGTAGPDTPSREGAA